MRRTLSVLTAAALLVAPSVTAQTNACAERGARLPAAGSWASYASDSGDFKLLYVGHETRGDRMEMTATRMCRRSGQPPTTICGKSAPAPLPRSVGGKGEPKRSGSTTPFMTT